MRFRVRALAAAAVVSLSIGLARESTAEFLQILSPPRPVEPGTEVQLRTIPPLLEGQQERWEIVSGPGALGNSGIFRAPYVLPPGAVDAKVRVIRGPKEAPVTAEGVVRLAGGAFPGAEQCRGQDQVAFPERWTYVPVDQLPEAMVHPVPPYPPEARFRGREGSLIVNALVCRDGHVLDAYVTWPTYPVAFGPDPSMERSAVSTVLTWTFRPALLAGKPVATWVAIPISFRP